MLNDIHAHQASVDSINDAGKEVIRSEGGGAVASRTRARLDRLAGDWEALLGKARDRQLELEAALRESQGFQVRLLIYR